MGSPFCDDCFKGVIHEGESKGQWESIGGVNCYVGTPSKDYDKTKAVLYLSDVFGMQLINNQLIVDSFADNGFLTIGIDYFNGDPVGENALGAGIVFDREAWLAKHRYEETRPFVDKAYEGLKERGVAVFGAVGYCFGASYAFPLAIENKVKATMIAHPARSIPESLQDYFNFSKAPLLINSCEFDPTFPLEACAKADDILGEGKFAPGYKRVHWEGCKHGFAVRGDMSDPKVKAGKEGAFKETVEWFSKYL
ncbi:dienelactone hydrolase endo-1,3,1,4-beta-D-glucanase [Lentinula edodes]|uniref:Dienelactone hydrolase endo-1,3,1,4-beta-D-glucanase n=1 Tax=Lentinula lateritia TaxID=40482 RepID=A0A9W9AYJ1_9AGAR|nr:dienelactone hydrolase endo-1,3,1,4-beta-D-glucanase [Lentinula edodes]